MVNISFGQSETILKSSVKEIKKKKRKKRRAENRKTINYEANTLWNALRPVLGARDLNHKSTEVQQGIIDYLSRLKSLGFDSWRYDFVKGYPP